MDTEAARPDQPNIANPDPHGGNPEYDEYFERYDEDWILSAQGDLEPDPDRLYLVTLHGVVGEQYSPDWYDPEEDEDPT